MLSHEIWDRGLHILFMLCFGLFLFCLSVLFPGSRVGESVGKQRYPTCLLEDKPLQQVNHSSASTSLQQPHHLRITWEERFEDAEHSGDH
jgi:hypothetical protein